MAGCQAENQHLMVSITAAISVFVQGQTEWLLFSGGLPSEQSLHSRMGLDD